MNVIVKFFNKQLQNKAFCSYIASSNGMLPDGYLRAIEGLLEDEGVPKVIAKGQIVVLGGRRIAVALHEGTVQLPLIIIAENYYD